MSLHDVNADAGLAALNVPGGSVLHPNTEADKELFVGSLGCDSVDSRPGILVVDPVSVLPIGADLDPLLGRSSARRQDTTVVRGPSSAYSDASWPPNPNEVGH